MRGDLKVVEMATQSNAAPVIIKRKKVVAGDGHHGGAWKVAYADFVTAMMAFFLLMWLLNATTEKQRKGLADYFSPSVPVSPVSGGGDGAFGGDTLFSEFEMVQNERGASERNTTASHQARGTLGIDLSEQRRTEDEDFRKLEEALLGRSGESLVSDALRKHIVTRVTDEGLIVELFDTPDQPLFEPHGATPTPVLRGLLGVLSRAAGTVTNGVALGGHVRARPVVLARNPVWDLSTARATRIRVELESLGVQPDRMQRVTGHADRRQVDRNPMAARNNRIELTFLRN